MAVVRPPAAAGSFYPGSADALRLAVDELLAAGPAPSVDVEPAMLIVPHAGYVYSGPVAATAYRLLASRMPLPVRLGLLGPAHFLGFAGIAGPDADAMHTPLGLAAVSSRPIPGTHQNAAAHAREHSLEVQLPFLQRILDVFTVVPLLTGDVTPQDAAAVLASVIDTEADFTIISSDLSHYHDYDIALRRDARTARAIVGLNPEDLEWDDACGLIAVQAALIVARQRGWQCRLVDLRNSGDTAGDRARVVGYGAFALGPVLASP